MAIITFKSNEQKETGQTLSLIAVATQMAIEHSYKILVVSTSFKDQTLENCYWELDRLNKPIITDSKANVGVDSGIEGLIKVLASNKTRLVFVCDDIILFGFLRYSIHEVRISSTESASLE